MLLIRNFIITFISFMLIDLFWLGIVARGFYKKHLGYIMKPSPNWQAAVLFYLFYICGILFFVIYPALNRESWRYALLAGFLFGFITYMTYDLTNLATLKGWPLIVTVIDIIWGTILGGGTALLSFTVIRLIK